MNNHLKELLNLFLRAMLYAALFALLLFACYYEVKKATFFINAPWNQ